MALYINRFPSMQWYILKNIEKLGNEHWGASQYKSLMRLHGLDKEHNNGLLRNSLELVQLTNRPNACTNFYSDCLMNKLHFLVSLSISNSDGKLYEYHNLSRKLKFTFYLQIFYIKLILMRYCNTEYQNSTFYFHHIQLKVHELW